MRIHNCILEEERGKVIGEVRYRTSVIDDIVKRMYAGKNEITGWLLGSGSRRGNNYRVKEAYIQPRAEDRHHVYVDKEYLVSILKNQNPIKRNCLVGCFHTHISPQLTVVSPCFYLRTINLDDKDAQTKLQNVGMRFMNTFLLDGETLHSKAYRINVDTGEEDLFKIRKM